MTKHYDKIVEHYLHAIEKHPHFADMLLPKPNPYRTIRQQLQTARTRIAKADQFSAVDPDMLLRCEVLEIYEALERGDYDSAVEEAYDAIAVLMRLVDMITEAKPA